jgi:hypothetical protein
MVYILNVRKIEKNWRRIKYYDCFLNKVYLGRFFEGKKTNKDKLVDHRFSPEVASRLLLKHCECVPVVSDSGKSPSTD